MRNKERREEKKKGKRKEKDRAKEKTETDRITHKHKQTNEQTKLIFTLGFLVGRRCRVLQQLLNQVDVCEDHAAAAVTVETELVERITVCMCERGRERVCE